MNHSGTPKSWTLDNGTHPEIVYFSDWSYDEQKRHFLGTIDFGDVYYGL